MSLKTSNIGCHIGSKYFGRIGYADDLDLLCPTAYGLQKMLNICESLGEEYGVTYNTQKTVCMSISHRRETIQSNSTQEIVKWASKIKHLEYIIRCDLKAIDDITRKTGDFIGLVNKVLVEFQKAPDRVISEHFNSKCAQLYGCEAWDQHHPCVDKFYTSWNKGVRRLYYLPSTTHQIFIRNCK